MKIVVLDGYTLNPGDLSWETLEQMGEVTLYEYTKPEEILTRIGDAQIVLTNKTPITAETMQACPAMKYIGVLATGFNVVDVAAAKAAGIVVTNVPSYGTQAVAQYVFALLLELCHRVAHHNEAVQEGRWSACRDFCFWDYPMMELEGKTIGIVGYGRIGRATAQIAKAFGMRVLAYARHGGDPDIVSLEQLFRESDVISLHCPLTAENEKMINRESIARMKDGVILINTARGALVDEIALREALESGKVKAAAVDVVSTEPIHTDNPLLGLDNCLITPHIAWANKESRQRLMDVAMENVQAYLDGHPIHNVAQ